MSSPPPPPLPPTPPPGDRWPRPPGCKIPPPITFASPPLGPVSPPLTPPLFPPLQPAAAAVAGTKKNPTKPLPPPPPPPSSARGIQYWLEAHPYRLLSPHGSRFQNPNLAPIVIPKGGATGAGLETDPWVFADDSEFVPWSRRRSRSSSPPPKKKGGSAGEGEDKEHEGAAIAAVEDGPRLQDPATQS